MHISKLTLQRFRGAQDLPLDLDDKLNVFVGMNGAGKSSILDASAIMLSWLANRIKHAGASGRPIAESDIRNGESSANLAIQLCDEGTYFGWNLAKVRKGYSKKDLASVLISASETAKGIQAGITEHNGKVNIPLFAYYPVNRAVLDIPLRIREKHQFGLLSAYEESLTSGANFRTFFEWFREREDLENENRKYKDDLIKPDDFEFPDPQLTAVRRALEIFMPDFQNLTVRRQPLRMEVTKKGQRLTVNQLSDGEKCLMAMVGDLARRMAIANPEREDPLLGDGIVMIDEIDLHLHPKWQRLVVPSLRAVFPNCQFFISTHSPHVITHVKPENLFLMNMTDAGELEVVRPNESYGKTVDRVLEDLMGLETTRPDQVEDALRAIYGQINDGELDTARKGIAELERDIGEDPELVKAKVLIKRKELIGR
ncbi:AAA family ATPase [Marinobacter nauticus]|uniref:ATP-binding protein involved in virulence n=1 Tax=Marinobacter nauticus TaxID=2743 RepID=A0A368UNI7_MARNT|nr:AAA family ATPase [Marinobacter nauticus]RBP68861.1 putative ATP-binding protein involved in virulence [Marinobacter nauticus]RCW30349.1 putative ATP-binding protein involved in virulence [Marinobacter nauticus]